MLAHTTSITRGVGMASVLEDTGSGSGSRDGNRPDFLRLGRLLKALLVESQQSSFGGMFLSIWRPRIQEGFQPVFTHVRIDQVHVTSDRAPTFDFSAWSRLAHTWQRAPVAPLHTLGDVRMFLDTAYAATRDPGFVPCQGCPTFASHFRGAPEHRAFLQNWFAVIGRCDTCGLGQGHAAPSSNIGHLYICQPNGTCMFADKHTRLSAAAVFGPLLQGLLPPAEDAPWWSLVQQTVGQRGVDPVVLLRKAYSNEPLVALAPPAYPLSLVTPRFELETVPCPQVVPSAVPPPSASTLPALCAGISSPFTPLNYYDHPCKKHLQQSVTVTNLGQLGASPPLVVTLAPNQAPISSVMPPADLTMSQWLCPALLANTLQAQCPAAPGELAAASHAVPVAPAVPPRTQPGNFRQGWPHVTPEFAQAAMTGTVSWPEALLDLPCVPFNRFLKKCSLTEAQVEHLKKTRRRKKNRHYAKKSRSKKTVALNRERVHQSLTMVVNRYGIPPPVMQPSSADKPELLLASSELQNLPVSAACASTRSLYDTSPNPAMALVQLTATVSGDDCAIPPLNSGTRDSMEPTPSRDSLMDTAHK